MKRKNRFVANTFLLTAVTLIMRAVSISFNVYIAGKIGAQGMGLFSLVMSVYSFGVTFACSGINLASTKIVSEEIAYKNENGIKRAINKAIIYSLFFGTIAFSLIFFGASYVGNVILSDARTVMPLKILSVSLPCVSLSSAISGYFNAVGRVYKGAAVQVLEQFIRISGCVLLLNLSKASSSLNACICVVLSGSIAEFLSFIVIFIVYRLDVTRYKKGKSGEKITKRLLGVALPIAVSSYARSGLSTIEHSMIPKGLKKNLGNSELALSAYGVVHGMVMPLIFFPSSILQAFSTLLVPELTIYSKTATTRKISSLIENSLYATMVFSIGCSGIMFFFADEIGMYTYKSREVAYFLKILAPLAALMYADEVVDAVLKGLNQQVYSMGYNIFDSALAIVLILFLLPSKGIYGYILIIYITEMTNAFLSINRLIYVADFKIRPIKWTLIPTLCITVSSYFIKSFLRKGATAPVFAIILVFFIYLAVMLIFFFGDRLKSTIAKRSLM